MGGQLDVLVENNVPNVPVLLENTEAQCR